MAWFSKSKKPVYILFMDIGPSGIKNIRTNLLELLELLGKEVVALALPPPPKKRNKQIDQL